MTFSVPPRREELDALHAAYPGAVDVLSSIGLQMVVETERHGQSAVAVAAAIQVVASCATVGLDGPFLTLVGSMAVIDGVGPSHDCPTCRPLAEMAKNVQKSN